MLRTVLLHLRDGVGSQQRLAASTACSLTADCVLPSCRDSGRDGRSLDPRRNAGQREASAVRACASLAALSSIRAARDSWGTSRMFCSEAGPTTAADKLAVTTDAAAGDWRLVYSGPQASTLRWLKAVSVTTATLSVFGSPLVCVGMGGSMAVKAAGAVSFASFSLFTTGLLHWFTGPYVHTLWYNPDTEQLRVKKLTIFAQYQEIEFPLAEVKPPSGFSPLQTFDAAGRTLYVDENFFADKDLLAKLTPPNEYEMPSEAASNAPGKDRVGQEGSSQQL